MTALDTAAATDALFDDERFKVLNAIHLKRMASSEQLATLLDMSVDGVERCCVAAAADGLLMTMPGGHLLLPEGTDAVQQYYREHYAEIRQDARMAPWYARFETLNTRFIALLSKWQRDSSDEDALYKALETVEQLATALATLAPLVPRYVDYQRRFAAAIDAIENGDTDLLCNPRRDSAHNIWFEFHEDILGVLARPRDTT
jgi:hypothetical protein